MHVIKEFVILCLVVSLSVLANCKKPPKLAEIEQLRVSTVQRINRLWRKLDHQEWQKIAEERGGKDVRLLEEFGKICEHFSGVHIGPIPELIVAPVWSYAIIDVETMGISGLYKLFRQYQTTPGVEKNPRKWMDFAENVVYDTFETASVSKAMDSISVLIRENEQQNIFNIMLQEADTNLCNVQQSPQQVIYNIYASLQMTQLKGYSMMQFSWMLLRLYNKGNFTLEANLSKEKYLNRTRLQVEAAKIAMAKADQSIWRCDPKEFSEGETYTQITKLLQGYILNEIDMNGEATCRENCGYYGVTKQHGCYKNNFCSQQKSCGGRLVNCQYIDSDMTVCQSSDDNLRYDWIEYENGRVLGDKKSCRKQTKVDSWWRYLFWHCSFCFCICDDPFYSDRFISLREAVSDIKNNKVITALRFVKHDHIIHLKIQDGVLKAKGNVDESSISWRQLDSFVIGSSDVKDGKDYHMLTWEERAIDFDDLLAPTNYVMTGVRFRKVGAHLNLEIRITPFNFTTGELIDPELKSEWISNDKTEHDSDSPRMEVKLNNPNVPIKGPKINQLDTKKNQFMLFTHTDMDSDAAQHTVPFIDTQIVGPQPPTPLAGAGIMHKGMKNFGGFIAPKVFTYNFADHLQLDDYEESK